MARCSGPMPEPQKSNHGTEVGDTAVRKSRHSLNASNAGAFGQTDIIEWRIEWRTRGVGEGRRPDGEAASSAACDAQRAGGHQRGRVVQERRQLQGSRRQCLRVTHQPAGQGFVLQPNSGFRGGLGEGQQRA